MALHELIKLVRKKRRVGRGLGGRGKKSGRGMKGQKARAGAHLRAGFEGGQTPLYKRLPKGRGSKQYFPSQVRHPVAVPVKALARFAAGSTVDPAALTRMGLMASRRGTVKLIGKEPLDRSLTVRVHRASAGAVAAVRAGGGTVELIPDHD